MTERASHQSTAPSAETDGAAWDVPTLAAALRATPEPIQDLFFGAGTAVHLGPERTVLLALYPEHGAVELTTPDLVVSFRRPAAARALDGGVLFIAESRRTRIALTVDASGGLSLLSDPLPADPPSPGLIAELARHGIAAPADRRPDEHPIDRPTTAGEGGER